MINITLGDAPKEEAKPFPKLMKYTTPDDHKPRTLIILAVANNGQNLAGTCLVDSSGINKPGRYQEGWNGCKFVDYNGPITIQNE